MFKETKVYRSQITNRPVYTTVELPDYDLGGRGLYGPIENE